MFFSTNLVFHSGCPATAGHEQVCPCSKRSFPAKYYAKDHAPSFRPPPPSECPCPCHGGLLLLPVSSLTEQRAYLGAVQRDIAAYAEKLERRRLRYEAARVAHAAHPFHVFCEKELRPHECYRMADLRHEGRALRAGVERLNWVWHFYGAWLDLTDRLAREIADAHRGWQPCAWEESDADVDLHGILKLVDGEGKMPYWME